MSELENGKPFSEVVKAAKGLGYTEPGQIIITWHIIIIEFIFQNLGPLNMFILIFLSMSLLL